MNEAQKRTAAAIAIGFISLGALFLLWIAIAIVAKSVTAASLSGELFYLMTSGGTATTLFGALNVIIMAGLAAGVAVLGPRYIWLASGVILIGLATSVSIWVLICATELGREVSQNVPEHINISHRQLEANVTAFSSWAIGAWVVALAAVLGITQVRKKQ
ncbi:MAG: hypothetical protein ACT4N8_13175 [Sphingosinicella sp.]|uniref:hypothetical protein n=1 Tax=Sphingosinicella sp. TaxID=1917971 RepID=UPI004037D5CB